MRVLKPLAVLIALLLVTAATAQVGVETGVLMGGNAGAVGAFRNLGSAVSRSVFRSTHAAFGPSGAAGATGSRSGRVDWGAAAVSSAFSLVRGQASLSRTFIPPAAGGYVAGVSWATPGSTAVALKAGAKEATGTAAAPLLLHFHAASAAACSISLQADGQVPPLGLTGDLAVVRDTPAGQPRSKSLLSPAQRLAQFVREGPIPSLWPLLANLVSRHLSGVAHPTDLDRLFDKALLAAPQVTSADLQAVLHEYDNMPASARAQLITKPTRALRALPTPTMAAVSQELGQPGFGTGPAAEVIFGGTPPVLTGLQPRLAAGQAYPPGALIRITGQNFAPEAGRDQVYLGTDLKRLLSGPPLPVVAASTGELQFRIPADQPDGSFYLLVMVDRHLMSTALSLQVSQAAVMPQLATASQSAGRYRLSCRRLECVDESSPKWWGDDNVALLWTVVADNRAVTQARGPYRSFHDQTIRKIPAAAQFMLPANQADWAHGVKVSRGLGLVVDLWQWYPPATAASLGPWALRESFANALAAPHPHYDDPKPQDDVSRQMSIQADLVGEQKIVWSAQELAKLLAPGQKLTRVLELRRGDTPAQYGPTGFYKLYVQIQRLD